MRIQYEEKTFEGYFNAELARNGIFFFPPGQVQEGSMGADAVVMSRSRWLWRRLGHPYFFRLPFQGARYREMAEEMERYLEQEITNVPDIQGNIFFQYKRSEYMVMKSAEEWEHWNKPYFRYEIYREQHELLEHLHNKFEDRVLILYAAPAIQDVNELVDLHKNSRVVDNTNFRPAHELSKHRRNTFVEPGAHSWACSVPFRLEPFSFQEALLRFKIAQTENRDSLAQMAADVHEILMTSELRRAYQTLSELYRLNELPQSTSLLLAYARMAIFRELSGVQWLVVHRRGA